MLQPNSDRTISIRRLESALSDIGLHGGNVTFEVDEKRSKDGRSVPRKFSMNRVKARKFLSLSIHNEDNSSTSNEHHHNAARLIKYNRWRTVHNAVVDHADNGRARSRKAEVWKLLDTVFQYFVTRDSGQMTPIHHSKWLWKILRNRCFPHGHINI